MNVLYGKKLQGEIKKILKSGGSKKFAVAFIGSGTFCRIQGKCDILCDLFSAGTNPYEIRKLRSIKNVTLRHLKKLHTKIYLSDNLAIIGSANMSNRALDYDGSGNSSIEAAVMMQKKLLPKIYGETKALVNRLWRKGQPITKDLIETAIEAYERDNRLKIKNLEDFLDNHFFATVYVDDELNEDAEEMACYQLGKRWEKFFGVFENWNKLPLGYLIDLYWNPKTDKIKYNGILKYSGICIPFKYKNKKMGKGSIQIAKKIDLPKVTSDKIKTIVKKTFIPGIKKKMNCDDVRNKNDGVVIPVEDLFF